MLSGLPHAHRYSAIGPNPPSGNAESNHRTSNPRRDLRVDQSIERSSFELRIDNSQDYSQSMDCTASSVPVAGHALLSVDGAVHVVERSGLATTLEGAPPGPQP